ncbi:hypothetical protein ACFQQB_33315 [Nonomuraea rubra]
MLHPDLYLYAERARALELRAEADRHRLTHHHAAHHPLTRHRPTRFRLVRCLGRRRLTRRSLGRGSVVLRPRSEARTWGQRLGWTLIELGLRLVVRY